MSASKWIADVGNSRIKIARCSPDAVGEVASWYHDDAETPARIWAKWEPAVGDPWALAGSAPDRLETFRGWLEARGQAVRVLASAGDLPVRIAVRQPETVGLDRLLNAVAVAGFLSPPQKAVVIDAGTAVTVDLVGVESGLAAFLGGVILPGPRLMGRALNDYTAKLPRLETFPDDTSIELPGLDTESAIRSGILCAVAGGIRWAVDAYRRQGGDDARVWLTGGYAPLLAKMLAMKTEAGAETLTLEGIRRCAR